jgi:hypothetical protein
MGSAAPMHEAAPEPDGDRVDLDPNDTNRRDVASYVSTSATKPSVPEPQPRWESQPQPIPAAQTASTSEPQTAQSQTAQPQAQPQIDRLQAAVLQALTDGNQRILVSMLEAGEWSVQGNELVVKIAESQTVIDMSVGPEARRLAIASASGVLGRAVKLKIVPGAAIIQNGNDGNGEKRNGAAVRSNGPVVGGRGRAEQDPVVQRMREKFGAEIRTVIDYKEKR